MAWDIIYYRAADDSVPSIDFLSDPKRCPAKVHQRLQAILNVVAEAPPPQFSGGGFWEAMHGEMTGYFEVRVQGDPKRTQYRLFCLLENGSPAELSKRGLVGPAIAVLTGMSKPSMTKLKLADYRAVRRLGDDHRAQFPRRIGT